MPEVVRNNANFEYNGCDFNIHTHHTGLDIGLVGPVARGASRFENLLAPKKLTGPGGQ